MAPSRRVVRGLLIVLLVAACAALAVAPLLQPAGAAPPQQAATHLLITQFRASGPGGAGDEFIELFNPTSSDVSLAGWKIGRNDCSGTTVSLPLFGSQDKILAGHYFLIGGLTYSGLAPDRANVQLLLDNYFGIALLDSSNKVVDAAGTCSPYKEGQTLLPFVGQSNQSYERIAGTSGGSCQDTNDNFTDFYLRVPSDPHNSQSGGAACQDPTATPPPTSGPPPTPRYGSIIINEVAWMGTKASSADQWIELYNPNSYSVDLKDWTLESVNGDLGDNGTLTLDVTIEPHCFVVIEHAKDIFSTSLNDECAVKTQVDGNLALSTYGDRLYLYSDSQDLIDSANSRGGRWPAGDLSKRESMERHSSGADNAANWYTFIGPPIYVVKDRSQNVVQGTPGHTNWAYGVLATASPVPTRYKTPTPRPPTPFGHVVINEFLPRAGTDWNQDKAVNVLDEFIEVKNLGPVDVDLRGWKLDNISSSGTTSFVLPTTKLKTGDRAVFYGSQTKIALYDTGGTVRITNARGVVIDARGYGPVENPDQSTCRIPDGYYWRFPCFPTPGTENSLTGTLPVPPPAVASGPPPCLLPDVIPTPFREAECYGFGSDLFNPAYWDNQSGFQNYPVPDDLNKNGEVVK